MAEKTPQQVATIYSHAGHSVELINSIATQDTITDEDKETLERNVRHLEIIRAYKKEDNTTSIWGSQDFSTHEAAITLGKSKYE
tara:strand:+ start:1906 stop:2157 length:252 start_codon:yes stop_codon:yes gene_type:complete